jgi:hypothetical protein
MPVYAKEAESDPEWRCPNIVQIPDGALQKCYARVRKRDIESHAKKKKHRYMISQEDDSEFANHMP